MAIAPHIPQCHHVRTNGTRCGSPSMRGRNQCFYHLRTSAKPNPRPTGLPLLEDGNAIQHGIAQIMRRVLLCDLDYKAAYVLLHAYKLSMFNLRNMHTEPVSSRVVTVDPAFDPENAGVATEPFTAKQLEDLAEELAESANVDSGNEKDNVSNENDGSANDLSSRAKPRDNASDVDSAPRSGATTHAGAPSNRSGFERLVGVTTEDENTPSAQSDANKSEGRHYLAQHVNAGSGRINDSSPVRTPPSPVAPDKRPVQRIVIPGEIDRLILKSETQDLTEEEFMKVAIAICNENAG